MNSARKLDALSSPARLRIVARRTEPSAGPLAPVNLTPLTFPAQPYRGLRLIKPGNPEPARRHQSDTLEQARRIVSQIEQEIIERTSRERNVRLRLCTPQQPSALALTQKEHPLISGFRALVLPIMKFLAQA